MKTLFTFLCFILISHLGYSQCPPSQSLNANTQADLDRFIEQYPNCTYLKFINIDGNDDYRNSPRNLYPLKNIVTVANSIYIRNCPRLESLEGLDDLVRVGRSLDINSNPRLLTTEGAPKLKIISTLRIYRNINLEAVLGFDDLQSLSNLQFFENPYIKSFEGLRNLREVGRFTINDCNLIKDLGDFKYLKLIARILELNRNYSLTQCNIDAVCSFLVSPFAATYINGNGSGCDSRGQIESNCTPTRESNIMEDRIDYDSVISVYPNPTSDRITIDFGKGNIVDTATVNIADNQGRVIISEKLTKVLMTANVSIASLSPGMYSLSVRVSNQLINKKIVVQ